MYDAQTMLFSTQVPVADARLADNYQRDTCDDIVNPCERLATQSYISEIAD